MLKLNRHSLCYSFAVFLLANGVVGNSNDNDNDNADYNNEADMTDTISPHLQATSIEVVINVGPIELPISVVPQENADAQPESRVVQTISIAGDEAQINNIMMVQRLFSPFLKNHPSSNLPSTINPNNGNEPNVPATKSEIGSFPGSTASEKSISHRTPIMEISIIEESSNIESTMNKASPTTILPQELSSQPIPLLSPSPLPQTNTKNTSQYQEPRSTSEQTATLESSGNSEDDSNGILIISRGISTDYTNESEKELGGLDSLAIKTNSPITEAINNMLSSSEIIQAPSMMTPSTDQASANNGIGSTTIPRVPPPPELVSILPTEKQSMPSGVVSAMQFQLPKLIHSLESHLFITKLLHPNNRVAKDQLIIETVLGEDEETGTQNEDIPVNMITGVIGVSEYDSCTPGIMRCTNNELSFDTCVYGRWGTIRACSEGTKCIQLSETEINCA